MTVYDPNQQSSWTPPGTPPGYATVPADSQPATGGDRWALVALAVSLTVLLSCVPGFTCLAPLVAGIIALTQVKNAANPDRARTYGWIATGIGIVIVLGVLAFLGLYGAIIASVLNDPDIRRSLEQP